jgi:hypothetical protein
MDPPTSSSSSSVSAMKKNDDHTTATLATATTTKSHSTLPKQRSSKVSIQHSQMTTSHQNNNSISRRKKTTISTNNINNSNNNKQHANNNHHHYKSSRNAAKIIKGEIHNVCLTMRSDPQYSYNTTANTTTSLSYDYRQQQQKKQQYNRKNNKSNNNEGEIMSINHHPILLGLRSLHDLLSVMEVTNFDDGVFATATSGFISSAAAAIGAAGAPTNRSSLGAVDSDGDDKNSNIGSNQRKQGSSQRKQSKKNLQHHYSTIVPVSSSSPHLINTVTFVSPFTDAVCAPDITAKTTGAALGALHKFILYGFIDDGTNSSSTRDDDIIDHSVGDDDGGRGGGGSMGRSMLPFTSTTKQLQRQQGVEEEIIVGQSIKLIAECIQKCSFEDYYSYWTDDDDEESGKINTDSSSRGVFSSFWSRSGADDNNDQVDANNSNDNNKDHHRLPSFITQSRRQNNHGHSSGSGGGGGNVTPNRKKRYYYSSNNKKRSTNRNNKDVILKLLSLSVQVLRCPAGRRYLSPKDILGIFDTCLHVAIVIATDGENDALLRSAAADALSHCVIVVFGMRDDNGDRMKKDHDADDNHNDDISDSSDDDWGERDPTEDCTNNSSSDDSNTDASADEGNSYSLFLADADRREDSNCSDEIQSNGDDDDDEDEPALVPIMHRLATLSDPLIHEDDTCVLALSLINIALETMSDVDELAVRYPRLLNIMQNDLCRNLLRLSTSNDLTILGFALRLIFNLFNGIKDHLKVQLEVFLTSVHLRILSFSVSPQTHERVWACSPERRELALESLLEFCREPMLMADLYLNYDCDMNCTNLFETICATLSRIANPVRIQAAAIDDNSSGDDETDSISEISSKRELNVLNRLALEGILAVIDAISRRCRSSPKFAYTSSDVDSTNHGSDPLVILPSPPDSGNSAFLGNTLYIRSDSQNESFEADYYNENVLRERKIQKRRLAQATTCFNETTRDKEWIQEAERVGVLPTPATPSSVALFLYSTPKLDKAKIGLYLSKGPKDKYPFHSEVLDEFASLFDFDGMSFSDALRSFLSRFRLPGEAQCIDRLMESFANRLYEVSRSDNLICDDDQAVEETMLDPPCTNEPSSRSGTLDPPAAMEEEDDISFPFRSADAAFILSFSTIMLNTDLHNPNMKDEKRMTLEQFIRNNRGINDGVDLPVEFLTNLYHEIKEDEIQVKQDLLQDGVKNFDGLLAKASDVAQPFFTPSNSTHQSLGQAGLHERDMFVSVSSAAIEAISAVYVDSWDDALVVKALDGLHNCAFVAAYFGLDSLFNHVIETMLGWGQDYLSSVAIFMYSQVGQDKEVGRVEAELAARGIPPLPQYFLRKSNDDFRSRSFLADAFGMDGSAAHRGLLSLDCALSLSRDHLSAVDEAWPILLDVIFALREVKALPTSLSELDDFADSRGNPLPPSPYARECEGRVNAYRESLAPKQSAEKGFWGSFFGSSPQSSGEQSDQYSYEGYPLYEALAKVGDQAQLDHIIAKTDDADFSKRILFAVFDSLIPDEDALADPLFEYNAVFILELAARFLISNRKNATELYSIFLSKFELFFSPIPTKDVMSESNEHNILGLNFPYILERIIVTILRSCIHFFDIESSRLREELNKSLRLITELPPDYLRHVSDRLGCGSAIILRGCFFLFGERAEDWSIIKCLLDLAAQEKSGRGFVFDGLASVIDSIDYTLPTSNVEEGDESSDLQLSQFGVEVIASLLLRYRDGSYEGDLSFRVPSMSYITKVYSYSQHFGTSNDIESSDVSSSKHEAKLQEYEFETMITAIYNDACLSQDGDVAKRGFESLQGIVLSTKVESIPVVKWLDFLDMVASNSPSLAVEEARISSLGLIGRLFLTLMPELSNDKENWSQLEDFTISSAAIVNENLRAGRATTLFEMTVETVSNVVNVLSLAKEMSMATTEGESFCVWASETLFYELECVGACGGVTNRPG